MGQKIPNNAHALLFANISAVDTSLTVEAGKADSFAVADTTDWLTPSDWFRATIEDAAGNIEIIKVGTRASGSGVFSVILRGQEGTTARAFAAGSIVETRLTQLDLETIINAPAVFAPSMVPVGGITMYDGVIGDLPANWKVCDGTGGTPDLRDRFIVGAGTAYAAGATGGSKDAIAVAHGHTATFTGGVLPPHNHTITDAGHAHSYTGLFQNYGAPGGGSNVLAEAGSTGTTTNTTGIALAATSAGTPTGTVAVSDAGASGVDKNLPPYYALVFIKRMS